MYLLFDIGGTKMRLAASRDLKKMGPVKIMATPENFKEGMAVLSLGVKALAHEERIRAVAGGLAGAFDSGKNTLVTGSNLTGWLDKPIKKEIAYITKSPVYLENDAALAGLGEATHGAGKNYPIITYLTISTGVGGARISNRKIDPSAHGFEPGYQIVDIGGKSCSKCKGKHLGAHISGRGIYEHYGRRAENIKDPRIRRDLARWLAYGVNNSVAHWSPHAVILGGSVMKIIPLSVVTANLRNIKRFKYMPAIRRGVLGDAAGLWGAMEYLRQVRPARGRTRT